MTYTACACRRSLMQRRLCGLWDHAQSKRSANVSDDSSARLRAQGVPGAPHSARMGNLMLQAPLGCSRPCPCPQAQPHPSSRCNPDLGRHVSCLARPLYGSGAWHCCTSPRHPRAQLFLGGSVSMLKALMRHAGLIICHLSIYLCICLSSIYFCVYHLFICHLSIIYLSICVSIIYLLTYPPPTNYTHFCIYHISIYQLSACLCIYHLSITYLLSCLLSSINFCIPLSICLRVYHL